MQKFNPYIALTYIGMVLAPIPPGIRWSIEAYTAALESGAGEVTARLAAVAIVGVLETIGIVSGHLLIKFARQRLVTETITAASFIVAYVSIGLLTTSGLLRVSFLLSAIMYGLGAMVYHASTLQETKIKREEADIAFRLQEKAKDNAARRARADRKQQLEHEARMATLKETSVATPVTKATPRQHQGNTGKKQATLKETIQVIWQDEGNTMTQAEIARHLETSPATVSKAIKALDSKVKTAVNGKVTK